jgi:hypothetical protein
VKPEPEQSIAERATEQTRAGAGFLQLATKPLSLAVAIAALLALGVGTLQSRAAADREIAGSITLTSGNWSYYAKDLSLTRTPYSDKLGRAMLPARSECWVARGTATSRKEPK